MFISYSRRNCNVPNNCHVSSRRSHGTRAACWLIILWLSYIKRLQNTALWLGKAHISHFFPRGGASKNLFIFQTPGNFVSRPYFSCSWNCDYFARSQILKACGCEQMKNVNHFWRHFLDWSACLDCCKLNIIQCAHRKNIFWIISNLCFCLG